jgi:hypothetical protein
MASSGWANAGPAAGVSSKITAKHDAMTLKKNNFLNSLTPPDDAPEKFTIR